MTPSDAQLPVPAALLAALQTDDWFAGCPAAFQQALREMGHLRRLAPGEPLFARGGQADGLCCVTAGALRVGAHDIEGQAAVLAYLEPYQWFGEISMIDGLPRTHDAEPCACTMARSSCLTRSGGLPDQRGRVSGVGIRASISSCIDCTSWL